MPLRTIEVIPNPYIALDKDGVPQGVVSAGMPGVFIGAQLDLVASRRSGKNRYYFPPNRDGSLKRKVHLTGDVATAILAGELIVANESDAAAVGFVGKYDPKTGTGFMSPDEALASERDKALAYYQSIHGKGAKIQDVPREPERLSEGDEMPIQTAATKLTPTVKMTKNTEA